MAVMGLDVGTTGIKCAVFDDNGETFGFRYKGYSLVSDRAGWYELPVRVLSDAAFEVIKGAIQESRPCEIEAICATSIGESMVLLDSRDQPVHDAILYIDSRGQYECKEFAQLNTPSRIFNITGEIPHPMLSLFKLKWLEENKKLEGLQRICFIADFVLRLLGGEYLTDRTLAARSCMLDINTNVWWKTALDYVGIQEFQMPGIVQTGSVVGTISKKVADTLGIGANTKLIIGGHDQIVAALGAGVAEAGQIMNGLGSVDNMTSVYKKEKKDERFAKFGFCIMPYFLADLYATYSYNLSGGAILRWFRDQLARDLLLPLEQNKLDPYVALNNEVGKIPADLLIMPHFSSTGTPYLDVNSKAIITGLTLNTTRGDLFRAFMEGEAFEMRQNLECLKSLGVEPREIITVGGGARSDVWMQIRADIFDKEVHVLEHKEAGTIGAAILCFLNTGRFTSLKEAFRTMYKGERVFVPYSENVEIYRSKFESYKRLYQMSKEFYGT